MRMPTLPFNPTLQMHTPGTVVTTLALCLLPSLPAHAEQSTPGDVEAIEQVIESFRTSLINKDWSAPSGAGRSFQ
ncbi:MULTISPECIES: hypothetical protein [Stenotrophomonas]|jgi:hypothetical protein|uniref:hypothetical protein n=1 Tax=Stenotrophomonas TaxID=40323 RepID=UPI000F933D4D